MSGELAQMRCDPRWRDCAVFAPLCAVVGAAIGLIVVPAYIRFDLIRQCGGNPFPPTMGRTDVLVFTAILCGSGLFVLGPAFIFAPYQAWGRWRHVLIFCLSLFFPWSILCFVVLIMTPNDGLWYRGVLNATAFLSLPVLNWMLCLGLYKLLQKTRVLLSRRQIDERIRR